MQKELLLAISDDRAASYNLRFLREVFTGFCDLKLTLFYVTPFKPTWVMDEQSFVPSGKGFDESSGKGRGKGEAALRDAEKWIKDVAGCSGENTRVKIIRGRKGTVGELIHEAREGLYDALVLGRRGFSWLEEVFASSVSHEMLLQDIDFPIWISKRPPEKPRKDVLLCMDGSAPALRIVDHAGYMLADDPQHTFTLFHVAEQGYGSGRAGRTFDEGLALLAENGVDEERIELKMVTGGNPLKAILKEAAEGNYCAVGVGKHGRGSTGRDKGLFPSSLTVNLLRQLESAALWISK